MLEEDYCSYEVAKLLKEKGFLKGVDLRITQNLSFYDNIGLHYNLNKWYDSLIQDKINFVVAPTHQMAMKWLREVHKLTFIISPQWAEGDMRNPCRWYWEIRGLEDINIDVYNNPLCNTYEEAVESALKYSLENLI